MQRGGIVIFEGIDKKDAEALKTASSPYRRTAETVFGGKKSENVILSFEVIRKDSCHTETGRDKKDAEASKIVTPPYKRTAEAIFGGRKSENIKFQAGIRQDSDSLSAIWDILKLKYNSLFSLFRSALF